MKIKITKEEIELAIKLFRQADAATQHRILLILLRCVSCKRPG